MKIGLYGISGVYNFGCEAIVRGTTMLIHSINPEAKVIYFSSNYEYDKEMLSDLEIEVIKIDYRRTFFDRVKSFICRILNVEHRPLFFDYNALIDMIDEIWSIGGDIYTIPEYKRRKARYEYYNAVIDFCDRAIDNGKKIVLYGASIGPFGNYEKAVSYYLKSLKQYKYIICRETETVDYLRKHKLKNVVLFPDPAFQIREEEMVDSSDKKYIGINLSPLSLNEMYGKCTIESQKKLAHIIECIIDEFDCEILLIPHVISRDKYDDDLRFQKNIIKLLDSTYNSKVKLADYRGGFLGVKVQVRQCKFLVSARMHLAINAIVENIPAIMLAYSSKSVGMCKFVYGNDMWVMRLKNIETDLIPKMKKMYKQKQIISEYLANRNREIDDEYKRLKNTIDLRGDCI